MTGVLRRAEPAAVGLGPGLPMRLDRAVREGLEATGTPGAVVLLAHRGAVVHWAAYGVAQDHDEHGPLTPPRPMRRDTVVDVASLTKVAATTAVAMSLVERGVLELDARVERHLGPVDAPPLTVRHLLEHRAGLLAWYPLYLFARDREEAIDLIRSLPLDGEVGAQYRYSDLGMMLLGAVLEAVAGAPLDRLFLELVAEPLGLRDSAFRPRGGLRGRCAATSTGNPAERRKIATGDPVPIDAAPDDFDGWRRRTLVGEVNDGNAAHAFGGLAGHAGLFSTAWDLAVIGQTLLQGGRYGRVQLWEPETVAAFTAAGADPAQGLGVWRQRWRALLAEEPDAGEEDDSFGHRGFTGCELVVCPQRDLVVIGLSNRLHTEEDPPTDDAPLWRRILEVVLEAL